MPATNAKSTGLPALIEVKMKTRTHNDIVNRLKTQLDNAKLQSMIYEGKLRIATKELTELKEIVSPIEAKPSKDT